jgi:hypothetical protein
MSSTIAPVAEAALNGKNVVLTTPPGIGTVSKTLSTLEAAGLSIGHLDVPVTALGGMSILFLKDDKLELLLHNDVLEAEVLVFDGIDSAVPSTLKLLVEVMTDRTLYGIPLPSVKSVVAIFVGDAEDCPAQFGEIPNTVTVNVR